MRCGLLLVLAHAAAAVHLVERLRGGAAGVETQPSYLLPASVGTSGGPACLSPTSMDGMVHWEKLQTLLESNAAGPSAGSTQAAMKLIENHVHVLKDVTHTAPLTQCSLDRVDIGHAAVVDRCLRFIAWRLLGSPPGLAETLAFPADESQAEAWRNTARFLDRRLQDAGNQHPGRKPDLSAEGSAAMRAVLREVSGDTASMPAPSAARSEPNHHLLSPAYFPAHFDRMAGAAA